MKYDPTSRALLHQHIHAQSAESAPAADAEFQDTVNPNWRACESVRALFATRALESYKKITESAELDGYEQELLQILTQMRAQPCTSNAGRSPNMTLTMNRNVPGRMPWGLPDAADEGVSRHPRARSPTAGHDSRAPGKGERTRGAVLEAELVAWAHQEAHHVLAPDLVLMLWSLAAVESKNTELVHALTVRANVVACFCTTSHLAMIWQALADMKATPRLDTMQNILHRVESIAPQFTLFHAKQTMLAMRKCGVRNGRAIAALKRRIFA